MKALLAVVMSGALLGVAYAETGSSDASYAMVYFEQPLGAGKRAPAAFGLRLDSARAINGARLPLLDLRMQARGPALLRFGGVPVLRYDGSVKGSSDAPESFDVPESLEDVPWWGVVLGGAALACVARIGICKDKKSDDNSGGSSSTCPTCDPG